MDGAHSGVGPSADDNVMPGFDGGGSWFECGGESGKRLMANAGVRRNAHCCRRPLRWMAKLRVVGSKLMIGLISRVVATVEAVGGAFAPLCYGIIEYSMYARDGSKSGLSTEFTSGLERNATVGLPYIPPSSITCSSWFPYMNHSSLDRVRMNLGGIHTLRPSTRTAHILEYR